MFSRSYPRQVLFLGSVALMALSFSCTNKDNSAATSEITAKPPVAAIHPTVLEKHGHERTDNYYWMQQRDTPEVLDYLKAENQYTEQVMAPYKELSDKLFEEMKGRIVEDDSSAPTRKGDYYYYHRYVEGGQYPLYCRKKGSLDAEEEIMLDGNKMGEGQSFFQIGSTAISTDQKILAFTVDTLGRRIYTLWLKNLETGELLADKVENVTPNLEWANDNSTLFYTRQDPTTLRYAMIYRHTLGEDPANDLLIYEEKEDTFNCGIGKTLDDRFLMIQSSQTLSSEIRILEADTPKGEFRVFQPRQRDLLYNADHQDNRFIIRTNYQATNFKIMETPDTATGLENWKDLVPHREDVFLEAVVAFKNYLVYGERKNGLSKLRIRSFSDGSEKDITFDEPAYSLDLGANLIYDSEVVRYQYTSMTTPDSTFDYNLATGERVLVKQEQVKGGFDATRYTTERIFAKARDGVEVPISLVYRKDLLKKGSNPLLLYGYGSYGATMDPGFRSRSLTLVDRGFVYAIAHIRGGQMLGRTWYENGKLLTKMNTFTDFIDCANYLKEQQYADPERMFALGGSAGGLLMGAVLNLEPTLFRGVIAAVPFVDVVTTMLDDSIPLTTGEYDEWGNPNDKTYYDYMLSYSPYDNVKATNYTNILVTTGYHDSQVQYWEPAKWVAKLRATKTDSNLLLLKTNMDAGHGGASGRFNSLKEVAFQYSFILSLAGIKE